MSDNERAEISQDYLVNPTFPMSKADILAIVAEAERSAAAAPPPGTRLILAHENLLDEWGTRTEDGRRITVEWGEPDEHGWYTPTFRKHERSGGAAPHLWVGDHGVATGGNVPPSERSAGAAPLDVDVLGETLDFLDGAARIADDLRPLLDAALAEGTDR